MNSAGNQYYNTYAKKIIENGREYANGKSVSVILDSFFITPDSEQGKTVLNALKANQLLFDKKYENCDLIVGPGFTPSCCVCSTKNYYPWKLIGVTVDVGCQVIKCILPLVLCEKCFRKRFCFQVQTPYLCGIAVFPPVEPSSKLPSASVSMNRVPVSSTPTVSEVPLQSKESGSGRPASVLPARIPSPVPVLTPSPNPPLPMQSAPPMQPAASVQSPKMPSTSEPLSVSGDITNYGVDDILGETRISDQSSISEPAAVADTMEDEVCYTLPFRQGGFFRTWLNSFFVINRRSISMYPNEKRNERKRKEILLYDASASHSALSSDSKHPYCVSIQPGASSTRNKAFVVSLPSAEEEAAFLGVLDQYMAIARQYPPEQTEDEDIEEWCVCWRSVYMFGDR